MQGPSTQAIRYICYNSAALSDWTADKAASAHQISHVGISFPKSDYMT
jgi:hypothetical protein